jgi:endonuclease YncB( thermonuclease family)
MLFKTCCSKQAVMTQTNSTMNELEQMTKQNTEFMTLKGNIYNAKIVYIYDGDTMHVVFKEFNKFYRWNCRIMGVDTPELRTKNLKEKEMGYKVRDILVEKLMNKIVKIKCDEFDKYGRLLIDVYIPNEVEKNDGTLMLSQWLIQNKYAYSYDGGTKKSWDNI